MSKQEFIKVSKERFKRVMDEQPLTKEELKGMSNGHAVSRASQGSDTNFIHYFIRTSGVVAMSKIDSVNIEAKFKLIKAV